MLLAWLAEALLAKALWDPAQVSWLGFPARPPQPQAALDSIPKSFHLVQLDSVPRRVSFTNGTLTWGQGQEGRPFCQEVPAGLPQPLWGFPLGHLPGDSVTQEQGLPYLRRGHHRIALPATGGSLPSCGSPPGPPQLPTYRGSPGDTGTEPRRALLLFLWSSLRSCAQPNCQQLLGPAPALYQALGCLANPHTYSMTRALGLAPFCRWGN